MKSKMISKDDRILVAGSTGMAGSAICRKLLEKGYGAKVNKGCLLYTSPSPRDS